MTTRANDLVDILSQVDFIKQTKLLTPGQKETAYTTLLSNLPAELLCGPVASLRAVTKEVLIKEIENNVQKESGPKKSTSKAKDTSGKSTEEKLLCDSDGDSRGKGAKKAVVNKEKKKPRKTKRGS